MIERVYRSQAPSSACSRVTDRDAVGWLTALVSDTLYRLLRRPERLVGAIVAADLILRTFKPGLLVAGLLDEAAHMATTVLIAGHRHRRMDPNVVSGMLPGSALIDLDHLPLVILKRPMASAEDRPMTHSLPTLAAVCIASAVTRGRSRSVLIGVTAGTACHFARDFATGGLPFFWPASRRLIKVPYAAYLIILITLAISARSDSST